MVRASKARKVPSQKHIKNVVGVAAGDTTEIAHDANQIRADSLSARELNDMTTKQLLAELEFYSKP